jgi:hypothetical protein
VVSTVAVWEAKKNGSRERLLWVAAMLPMATAAGPAVRKVMEAERCQLAVVAGRATETREVAPSFRAKAALGQLLAGSPNEPKASKRKTLPVWRVPAGMVMLVSMSERSPLVDEEMT